MVLVGHIESPGVVLVILHFSKNEPAYYFIQSFGFQTFFFLFFFFKLYIS